MRRSTHDVKFGPPIISEIITAIKLKLKTIRYDQVLVYGIMCFH